MKRVLHICTDEKFIDYAIVNFKNIDNVVNDFAVITNNKSLKYIKSKDVSIFSTRSFLKDILLGSLRRYDGIVFHSMNRFFKLIIKFLPRRVKVCWIGFGFDYYPNNTNENNNSIAKLAKSIIIDKILNLDLSYRRIDYFCPVLESEFDSVSSQLNLKAKYVDWNYGSSDKIVENLKDVYVDGDAILLGNSASETNNHIEMLDLFIENGEQREIVIPLSYGDKAYARKIILKLENSSLNYTTLTDYLTQEEYFNILKRCSLVIMNHKRQQAAGNILIMLSLGARVILDRDNPLYEYFSKFGLYIEDKNSLYKKNEIKLPEDVMRKNKETSLKNFNSKMTNIKTRNLVELLTS